MSELEVIGIKTDLVGIGDDLVGAMKSGMVRAGLMLEDGDIIVVSESAVATWEGRVVLLDAIIPSHIAETLAEKYSKDPREMELILRESDEILGGIPGVVLTLNKGFLYPNAGIDHSNAPSGHVVLFPADPQRSAAEIRRLMADGKAIGVIVGDSRTHPLRLGCVGVALGCSGIEPVEDARGQLDLYGRPLQITRKAVADNLVSAAQIVMGEGDEGIPAVIIRNSPVKIDENASCEIPTMLPQGCMYIGSLRCCPHPYTGGYDNLIESAKSAMENAYAPYSGFKVGAAILGISGRIYSAGNIENASAGAIICAERAAIAKAVSSGECKLAAIAIISDRPKPVAPCGICRPSISEFGEDIAVIMAGMNGDALIARIGELLPMPFTAKSLEK